jgi:hypothetical protein
MSPDLIAWCAAMVLVPVIAVHSWWRAKNGSR